MRSPDEMGEFTLQQNRGWGQAGRSTRIPLRCIRATLAENMIELSIPEFLATGHLGPIRLGSSEYDVKSALGEPTDVGGASRKYRRPTIWLYGDNVEIVFAPNDRAVVMILINFWRDRRSSDSPSFHLFSGGIDAGISRDEFVKVLTSRRLRYEERRAERNSTDIVVENKVSAIFGIDRVASETYRLIKLIASQ